MKFSSLTLYISCICVLSAPTKDLGTWEIGDSVLPRIVCSSAVGYWDGSLLLIGGYQDQKQLVVLDIDSPYNQTNPSVTDLSPTFFSGYGVAGTAQNYVQMNQELFAKDWNSGFSAYDLTTKQLTTNWRGVNIGGYDDWNAGCLTSLGDDYLFIVGGKRWDGYSQKTCLTYDMAAGTWLAYTLMNTWRANLACAMHPGTNTLYSFGGQDWVGGYTTGGWVVFDTMESLNLEPSPTSNAWTVISGRLLFPTSGARTVIVDNYIVIIGGYNSIANQGGADINEVQLFDVKKNKIFSGGYLAYPVSHTALINVNDVIYAFGGNSNGGRLNTWQYLDLRKPEMCCTPKTTDYTLLPKCWIRTDQKKCLKTKGGVQDCNWVHCSQVGYCKPITSDDEIVYEDAKGGGGKGGGGKGGGGKGGGGKAGKGGVPLHPCTQNMDKNSCESDGCQWYVGNPSVGGPPDHDREDMNIYGYDEFELMAVNMNDHMNDDNYGMYGWIGMVIFVIMMVLIMYGDFGVCNYVKKKMASTSYDYESINNSNI